MSVHVSGQRIACRRCALKFEVVRRDVVSGQAPLEPNRTPPPQPEIAEAAVPPAAVASDVDTQPRRGALAPTQANRSRRASTADTVSAPRQLPGFELTQLLGRGGMGEVWRARQLSLGREVAIKILSRDLARDPDFVKRFDLEASALTSLSHPHVVSIIDRGHHEGVLFFAMELVEGKSLRERLSLGELPVEEVLRLLTQILSALGHAHKKGIIHRDLKPENVLLDEQGTVKVVDFGLAAMAGLRAEDRITRSAVAMGTVSYMAPEQRRDAHAVDHRADLYSTGVVLYELLTGDVPVGAYQAPSRSRTDLGRAIDGVVERALAPEPEQRFQSADEMATALASAAQDRGWRGAWTRFFSGKGRDWAP